MMARLSAGLSGRGAILLAALFVVFLAAPLFVNDYLLTVLILIFYFAYAGQAWNIMMGFAGQLSLGHAIYIGFGAYVAATLFIRLGVSPWLGLFAAIPVAAACGAIIGFLAFRFRVAGVYFAILTIAFAEFARIGFDHLDFVNASGGLFLPVKQYAHDDPWQMRGDPRMFYYIILFATALIFVLCHLLVRSRVGYFWLAIREDEQAARATGIDTFRYKMYAVMVSAAATSFAGVFYAFYLQQPFSRAGLQHLALDRDHSRSDHRRCRDVVWSDPRRICADRPRRGAQLRDDCFRHRTAGSDAGVLRRVPPPRGGGAAGRRLAAFGAAAWRECGQEMTSPLLKLGAVSKRFRGLVAVDQVSFAVQSGDIFAVIGPNGAGKTTLFNMIAGAMAPDGGSITFAGRPIHGLPADAVCRLGLARTFQIVRPFPALSVEDNVTIGALQRHRDVEAARARAPDVA